jgi:hypothetical protein
MPSRLIVIIPVVALALACGGSPSSPSPEPSPTPQPTPQPSPFPSGDYRVSGIVTDGETGVVIVGARVIVAYRSGTNFRQSLAEARTNGGGRYELNFPLSANQTDGLISVQPPPGYWIYVQSLPRNTDVVRNVGLRPERTFVADGPPIVASIQRDSSLVSDHEWDPWVFANPNSVWEELYVSTESTGTLTIEARPDAGGLVPTVSCPYGGCPAGASGAVSFPVRGGSRYYFTIAIPITSAPQRYDVSASVR